MKRFVWNGLELLTERAVWREATRTLFVADVHFGKAATFRAAGAPVPAGTTRENLRRLDALIETLSPRTLVVLGDLFHAREAYASLDEIADWRSRRPELTIRLVIGNHDRRAGAPPAALRLEAVDEPFQDGGLECRHHPLSDETSAGPPTLVGHAHPVARLHGPGHDSLRLPCFVMRGRQLILPAFGEFTGGAVAAADDDTSLCIVAGEQFVHAPTRPTRARWATRG